MVSISYYLKSRLNELAPPHDPLHGAQLRNIQYILALHKQHKQDLPLPLSLLIQGLTPTCSSLCFHLTDLFVRTALEEESCKLDHFKQLLKVAHLLTQKNRRHALVVLLTSVFQDNFNFQDKVYEESLCMEIVGLSVVEKKWLLER